MKYTVTVLIDGEEKKITWEDGKVSCDDWEVIFSLNNLANAYEGHLILNERFGHLRLESSSNHLENPASTYWLIEKLGKIVDYTGDPLGAWGYRENTDTSIYFY